MRAYGWTFPLVTVTLCAAPWIAQTADLLSQVARAVSTVCGLGA